MKTSTIRTIKTCKTKLADFWQANRFLVKPFLALSGLYLLALSALLLANAHYADDVARTNFGYPGWAAFSRYINTAASAVLHADRYLTNIAPLPQLFAILLLAGASIVLVCLVCGKDIFKQKWTRWLWPLIATIPLGLCPYILECLSYQYDAPYMMLSVLAVILPFAFRHKSTWLYLSAIVVGTLVSCMTYQASVGIFGVVLIFLIVKDWSEAKTAKLKPTLKFALLSGLTFLATLVVFEKFLMRPRDVYVSNSLPAADSFLDSFISHLRLYFELILRDFKPLWLVLIGLILLSFVIFFVVKSRRNKLLAALIVIVALALMAVATFAPYAALERPPYTTRSMYPIGAMIALAAIYLVQTRGWQKLALIPVAVLSWCFFIFAFTYGNAFNEQTQFRDAEINMAIADLNELLPTLGTGPKTIQTTGQIDYAPSICHADAHTYWLLHRLLKPTFGRGVHWMAYRLTYVSGLDQLVFDEFANLADHDLPTLKETAFYTIKGNDAEILVEFHGELIDMEY